MRNLAVLLPLLIACDDDRLTGRVPALDHPELLDFGPVPVETSRVLLLPLLNQGDLSVRIERFVADTLASVTVETNPASLSVAPGVEVPVEVRFSPLAVTGPLEFDLVLVTAELGERTVRITGEGVREGLFVHPRPLDFGRVLRGHDRTRVLEIESLSFSDAPLEVSIEPPDRFALDEPIPERIRPGDRISVRFRYTPEVDGPPGRDDAIATWSLCPNQSCRVRVPFTGVALTAAVRCTPNPVDFGAVRPGSARTASIRCRNESDHALDTYGSYVSAASDPGFSAVDAGPRRLLPGESEDFGLRFEAPRGVESGLRRGTWRLDLADAERGRPVAPTSVALFARVGGPALRVRPAAVDFGRAAVGIPANAAATLENVGDEPLTVQAIHADGPFWVQRPSEPLVLAPGASERLNLVFTATTAGPARGAVRLRSDDPERSEATIELRGRGLALSDCELEATPSPADFGVLAAFRATVLGVALQNVGSEPCLVREPRVVGTAFSWARGEEVRLLLPGEASVHVLRFAPKDAAAYQAVFEVLISNRRAPLFSVPLLGEGGLETARVEPDAVDFGEVNRDCAGLATLRLHRVGSAPLTLEGIEVVSSGGGFSVDLPDRVPASARFLTVQARYEPGSDPASQPEVGRLTWQIPGGSEVAHVTLLGRPANDARAEERFRQGGLAAVDLLIVLDSSASMAPYQAALRRGLPNLLEAARERGIDLRLALVNMDTDPPCRPDLESPTSALPGTCGFFSQGDLVRHDPQWRVLSSQTMPSIEAAFQHTSNVGVGGSTTETGFYAADLALEPRRLLGYNRGFLERTDTFFAVMFVSDERDQSPHGGIPYIARFASITGAFDRDRYALTGILPYACSDDRPLLSGYGGILCQAGGVIGSLRPSNDDFGPVFDEVARAAFGQRRWFVLRRSAQPSSIEVEVDGVPLSAMSFGKSRWRYLPTLNGVAFAEDSVPAFGSEVVIRYRPRCESRRP